MSREKEKNMATIDLIVLGMLKSQDLSAYDIQKLVEYRNISKWVKISTPSIYKKVLQLEQKGLIVGKTEREGKMPEKVVYKLTDDGDKEFENLMLEISKEPIRIFLDFNAVMVNIDKVDQVTRAKCLSDIQNSINMLRFNLQKNVDIKEKKPNTPEAGMAVLRQQYILVDAIETWLQSVKTQYNID